MHDLIRNLCVLGLQWINRPTLDLTGRLSRYRMSTTQLNRKSQRRCTAPVSPHQYYPTSYTRKVITDVGLYTVNLLLVRLHYDVVCLDIKCGPMWSRFRSMW